jgi:lipopolysaccharide export system permease protein
MKLLDRYILSEFLRYFFVVLTTLGLVFYVAEFLRGGDANTTAAKMLVYNAFQLPATLVQMTAPAAMLATMVSLSMMNRRNELTAMQASGIGIFHIAFMIFGAVFIICCATLIVSDRVLPPMARARTTYLWREIKGRQDFSLDIKSSKIWYRSKNYIYNLKTFDQKTSAIQGFGVYLFDQSFNLRQHVEAGTATYDQGEWVLKEGMITIFPEDSTFPLSKRFAEKRLKLPDSPAEFGEIERQVETLRLKDLWRFIMRNKASGLKTDSYEVDFHARVSMSFIPLVMALLVVPFSVRPRRQGALGRDVSICIGLIMVYWILFSISLSLGRSGTMQPWVAVWTPSLFFLTAAIYQVVKK